MSKQEPIPTIGLVNIQELKEILRSEIRAEEESTRNEKPVTPEWFAEHHDLEIQHVYRLLQKKQIPGRKFGKLWRIYMSEVRGWRN